MLYAFQTSQEVPWVVTSSDKSRYDTMFKQADKDADGLVSGKITCCIQSSSIFSPNSMLSHWLLRGHMTSKDKTFSRQKSVSGPGCKI